MLLGSDVGEGDGAVILEMLGEIAAAVSSLRYVGCGMVWASI